MIVTFAKDKDLPRSISGAQALEFFRAFRRELFRAGVYRDPKTGDELMGVRIVGLTI